MVSDSTVIFDHLKHRIYVLANVMVEEGGDISVSYEAACDRVRKLKELLSRPLPQPVRHQRGPLDEPVSNFRREDFESAVERVKEYIIAYDSFQTVPSQRFQVDVEVSRSASTGDCGRSIPHHICTTLLLRIFPWWAPRRNP